MYTNTIISILGLAASANAHVNMNTPKGWTCNSSPLEKDGSDFPCKGVAYDSSVPVNKMKKGDKQPMNFIGSAVHGGGSCQVSLTTDTEPTKDSVWKVIKSFEGGCPDKTMKENYPDNPQMVGKDQYDFEIPDDVPAGKYTLAWTWFNTVGNREMYMNCAPIEASGSGGDESAFGALPDMFTANIFGKETCETTEGVDLTFPDPGEYVERLGSGKLEAFKGKDCPAGAGGSGGGSGGDYGGGSDGGSESSPAESAPAETVAPSPAPEDAPIQAPIEDGSGDAQPTEAPSAPASSAPAEPEPTSAAAPVETTPAAAPEDGDYESPLPDQEAPANNSEQDGSDSAPSESESGAGGYEAGAECTTDGFWNCIDGTSFQRCASGTWSAVQQLSEGSTCTPGESENIQMTRKRGNTRFGAKFLL